MNVVLPDLRLGGLVAQDDHTVVLAQNNAVVTQIILGLDAHGVEVRLDHAIWVNNVDEQILRAVRAHAIQIRSEVRPLGLELVTRRTVLCKDFRAVRQVPGFDDFGTQLGDERILLLLLGAFEFLDHHHGAFGHRGISVRAQPI